MTDLSRRHVIAAGVVSGLPGLSLARAGQAIGTAEPSAPLPSPPPHDGSAILPREQISLDDGWRFALGHGSDPAKDFGFGFGQSDFAKTGDFKIAKGEFDDSGWRPLSIPHDWAVELPFVHDDRGEGDQRMQTHGYKPLGRRYPETSIGWYRRTFDVPASDDRRRLWIEFDGVMRDSLLFVNGCYIGRNNDGYSPFRYDITDYVNFGGKNVMVLRVDASEGSGWFYEGAGIYRHVWLVKHDAIHLGRWDSVVRSTVEDRAATLDLSARVQNQSDRPQTIALEWLIHDRTGRLVGRATSPPQSVSPGQSIELAAQTKIAEPLLWSTSDPHLYVATARLSTDGRICDADRVVFGICTTRFDPAQGFFLNGLPLKIQGTCNHQDHAGVGVALPDALQTFRLDVLRQMGCNAVRTSHNAPTPEWVEACERGGVMMMCETRQMSASPEGLAQLEAMVKRFRNSPAIIIWSIGNEEYLLQQGAMAPQGARIAADMVRHCKALDPTRPVSAAVNGDNEQGVTDPLDLVGFNYHQEWPEPFHQKHPERPIFGSETSSAISTRGEYSTDPTRNTVNSYDGVVSWGQTPEQWWQLYGGKPWSAGGFAWTGFDYRGEPTPYSWPSISSQFGIVDTCGFPKDYFYYYKAWWRPEPALHLFPHWDWAGREGEIIQVWAYSNCEDVELFVNGRSCGRRTVLHFGHVAWQVPFEPGVIEARGRRNGRWLTDRRETTGPAQAIRLSADRTRLRADGRDVAILRAEVLDRRGRVVPTAMDRLGFSVTGPGKIIGVGNGDPNCLESDQLPQRSLFNGLAQLIVQSTRRSGELAVHAFPLGGQAGELKPFSLALRADPA